MRSGATWSQQAKLTAADAEVGDSFSGSVALAGDTVLVGASFAGPENAGSAYVFVRSGAAWGQQAKLVAGDAEEFDIFGSSVALAGDTIVVGAWAEDPDLGGGPLDSAGSAYVFVSPTDLLYLPLILKN